MLGILLASPISAQSWKENFREMVRQGQEKKAESSENSKSVHRGDKKASSRKSFSSLRKSFSRKGSSRKGSSRKGSSRKGSSRKGSSRKSFSSLRKGSSRKGSSSRRKSWGRTNKSGRFQGRRSIKDRVRGSIRSRSRCHKANRMYKSRRRQHRR